MKNIYLIMSFLVFSALMYTSCTPDKFELGNVDIKSEDLVEGIAYKIEHDADNPNIVYLTSLMDSEYTPLWNHPQGRSQEQKVTLKMPFEGDYDVQFGVQTRGGYVYGDSVKFTIDEMYPGFIDNELWTFLSGGIGKSKTWVMDLFPEEEAPSYAKYFNGPLYFYDMFYYWENVTGDLDVDVPEGSEDLAWGHWEADWAANKGWLFGGVEDTDYGTMTFDLIDGAHMTVNHKILGRQESGTYLLDTDNHTMQTTDAFILHDASRDGQVVDWGNIRILALTDTTMQLAVIRDPVLSGDGETLLSYNFVSKEYSDNWVAGEIEEPEPELPDGWVDDVSKTVSYAVKWVLSPETPFNWANLDGSLMNNWNSVSDYPGWTGFDATIPDTYADFSLTLDATTLDAVYVDKTAESTSGTYVLDEEIGMYSFDGFTPSFNICSWVNLNTSEENTWRITAIEKDLSGNVSGMWVGYREIDSETGEYKDQYMVYKLVPTTGEGSGEGEPSETELSVDNTKLLFGNIEDDNDKYRIEIYNEYGASQPDPCVVPANVIFGNSIEITFTLSGITLIDGATGSYKTAIQMADADWSTSYWGDGTGEGEATITGNGTYTVTWTPPSPYETALVFCVDIVDLVPDLADLNAVTATVDKVVMY